MTELAPPASELAIATLTGFTISPCGHCVRLGMQDSSGIERGLALPFPCLGMLLMTLPKMIEEALKRQTTDPTMRHVFPLEDWDVEIAMECGQVVVAMSTGGGFRVRFSVPGTTCAVLATRLGEAAAAVSLPLDSSGLLN
jgi:hypothetical protein